MFMKGSMDLLKLELKVHVVTVNSYFLLDDVILIQEADSR